MIALADKYELRLILPFIDHWKWWGGREQLAAFYNETEADFYDTHSKTFRAYQSIIQQVITRKNTITHRYYYQEKAILAWETGNELKDSTPAFVSTTAAFIKSLDKNHLVVDGTYLRIMPESLNDPNIDIISNHFYTINGNNNAKQITKDLTAIKGKKVYLIGEFGLASAKELDAIMQAAVHTNVNGARAAGAFIWGFRGHRETGGFYWHKEYTGHYSYHLPGFPENNSNEEMAVIALVRQAQAEMAGLQQAPPLPIPEAPLLLSIQHPTKINWMGSPLGQHYRIERSRFADKDWETIATNISDGKNEFNPAIDNNFSDSESLASGAWYYRVFASNASGEGTASNIVQYLAP